MKRKLDDGGEKYNDNDFPTPLANVGEEKGKIRLFLTLYNDNGTSRVKEIYNSD